MKQKHRKKLIVFALALSLVTGCNSVKLVDYAILPYGTTKEALIEQIGSKPNETKTIDETTEYVYKKSKYLDYTGVMTYYSVQNSILFSRWESIVKTEEDAKKMYDAICENVKKEYSIEGEETIAEAGKTIVWSENGKNTTVAYLIEADQVKVSITK